MARQPAVDHRKDVGEQWFAAAPQVVDDVAGQPRELDQQQREVRQGRLLVAVLPRRPVPSRSTRSRNSSSVGGISAAPVATARPIVHAETGTTAGGSARPATAIARPHPGRRDRRTLRPRPRGRRGLPDRAPRRRRSRTQHRPRVGTTTPESRECGGPGYVPVRPPDHRQWGRVRIGPVLVDGHSAVVPDQPGRRGHATKDSPSLTEDRSNIFSCSIR